MLPKRKRPAPPLLRTLASKRSRRFPPRQSEGQLPSEDAPITSRKNALSNFLESLTARQPKAQPLLQTVSSSGQSLNQIEALADATKEFLEAKRDLSSVSERPSRVVVLRLPNSQSQISQKTSIISQPSDERESDLKRPTTGEDTNNSPKRLRRSPRGHQSQSDTQPQPQATPQTKDEDEDEDEYKEKDEYMAITTSTASTQTITPRPPQPQTDVPILHVSEQEQQDLDINIPELVRSRPYSGRSRPGTQLALSLPPLYKLSDIYKSLTNRAMELDLDDVLSHLGDRQLRVVTVCSGTESPLLALEMVKENLQKHHNRTLNFKHLFSAEIVPFKQAYIERNFHPPLLFRDVAELKDRVAQTAYGTLAKIPKRPDILIAGFSCVDFSALNNHRKTLDQQGESGGTFWGIVRYATTYRPRLVILENVKTAPWEKIEQHWNEIGYFAIFKDVDTKGYYLPQTRERGYMFCVDRRLLEGKGEGAEVDLERWTDIFTAFRRPASSPAGMFLMDGDDRRLESIEKDMSGKILASSASGSARATVNWARYQVRHQNYRLNQGLGHRRPVSKSQDDGTCRMPDFAWQTWVRSLPERVWDTIDVNFLRKLMDGYDMNYKERCLELSQGIDREIDSRAFGIVGCITPCGIPYMTTRGGPLCGLESLALQGLPLDRLLLTQESQRELQDLAGNAMSSTVVGAAILSALIVGYKVLEKGNSPAKSSLSAPRRKTATPQGEDDLVPSTMHLDSPVTVNISKLQNQAASSARYCMCERQSSTRPTIMKCRLCSHTACSECSGNPQHAYERWTDLVRTSPLDCISEIRSILPARLMINGITRENYSELQHSTSIPPNIWNEFLDPVMRAVGDELRFLEVKRSEIWTVIYEGKYSVLKLVIEPDSVTCLLFAKPRESDPTLCLIREILSRPIARMMVSQSDSNLEGTWEICAPLSSSCSLEFFGTGTLVQSYEAKCGLELEAFRDAIVWSHITVQGEDGAVQDLEADIRGTYELLQDCGTANACLHKRPAADGKPAVYLFLDPTKLGEPKNDSFVFALEHRRNPGYACRLSIAEVSHLWRSSRATETPELTTVYHRKWIACPAASLASYAGKAGGTIRCFNLGPEVPISVGDEGCHDANITLLAFTAPATVIDSPSKTDEWEVTDPIDSPQLLQHYAWLLQKAIGYSDSREWNEVTEANIHGPCMVCVPPKPGIVWGRNKRGWLKAYEDPYGAARYERQIKSRPPPFLIFRRNCAQGFGELRVTLNIQTLIHQAYDRLTDRPYYITEAFHWRLVQNSYDTRDLPFPKFDLKSNRDDPQSAQPPSFRLNLRPEQLRSLSWMVGQEKDDIEAFIEEETEEALLPSLMWRAEGKVTVSKTVRGGILADDVGYGKTAIILGLIDTLSEKANVDLSVPLNDDRFIPSKATLIVVPSIVLHQWKSEIAKFLGNTHKVLVFSTAATLKKASIQAIRNCGIVLVSWSVFNAQAYYQRLQRFTGASQVPPKAGRNFDDWFYRAHGLMRHHARVLTGQGPRAFLETLRARCAQVKDAQEDDVYVPSKRLRGKQYELANRGKNHDPNGEISYAELSDADDDSEASDEDDPDVLTAKVERLLTLVQPTTSPSQGEDEDEDTEDEKLGSKKSQRTWDDWQEFNISKTGKPQDWETVKGLPLHAFQFNRLVIDEFTYVDTDRLHQILALQARTKWVLSGTPPLNDFVDVNTIAPFLGVHLGINEDCELHTQNKRLKALHKQRSDAEKFQSFQAPRSEAWHRRRHEIAQTFLDRFARRNIAEIDEIPSTEHIVLVRQSPAEKAIYLELYKQLMTYNRQLRRSGTRGRFGSDQADRLDEVIASSSTPEEALIKRCTSLALQGRWGDDGKPDVVTCESLMAIREEQLEQLKDDLKNKLKLAAWVYLAVDQKHEKFNRFMESVFRHDFGDMSVTNEVANLLKTAIRTSKKADWKPFFANTTHEAEDEVSDEYEDEDEGKEPKPNSNPKGEIAPLPLPSKPTELREFEPILREVTTTIRNLIVEWVLRIRALRFLKAVKDIQTISQAHSIPACNNCRTQPSQLSKINILGSCGHALCSTCTQQVPEKEECAIQGCRGSGKRFNIISALTLGNTNTQQLSRGGTIDRSSKFGGTKLDTLIDLIRTQIPFSERALLFIQFPDLMDVASKALELAEIDHTTITATDQKSRQKIGQFGFGENKVLLLNLGSEMAAGLNLQCANHIIFLNPLHTQTQYDYDSAMIQAVGRCRRYGQTRHVHVYHLLAKTTVEVNIFQDRRGKVLVERNRKAVLVDKEEALELGSEGMSCQGPDLVVDNAF
ncbi:hypothetical protein BDV12DRAFT_198253 [Aspergillus spectabilis]